MSVGELQAKWDRRYRERDPSEAQPAAVLVDNAHLLPESGLALDLACGLGGNARWLAQAGLEVEAWDLSPVAVAKLEALSRQEGWAVRPSVRDATAAPPEAGRYDVIAISYFLDRALTGSIVAALRPGGLLFYQTFTASAARSSGPTNPAFVLQRNELLTLFADLSVVSYREDNSVGRGESPLRGEAWLIAQKPYKEGA